MSAFVEQGLRHREGKLILPITDIVYPDGMDEMIAAVKSRDDTRPGWITMQAMEAAGGDYTETVRNASEITFAVPVGYGIKPPGAAEMRFCFRDSKSLGATPTWITGMMEIPVEQTEDTKGSRMSLISGITEANGYRPQFVKFMKRHLKEPRPDPYSYIYEWARGMETNRQGMRGCSCQQRFLQSLDAPGYWKTSLKEDSRRQRFLLSDADLDPATYGGEPAPARATRAAPKPKPKPKPAATQPGEDDAALIADVQSYADETFRSTDHVRRWNEVLTRLGVDTGEPPMPTSEAERNYRRFSKARWGPVVQAFKRMDEGEAPAPTPAPAPAPAPKPTPAPQPVQDEALRKLVVEQAVEVTAEQLVEAVRRSKFHALRPMLLDRTFTALPMALWMQILEWSDVDQIRYVSEKRDCDNFAIALAGQIALRLGANSCGIVADFSGGHAYNCIIVADTAKGGCYVRLVEPQSDGLPQVGDKMSGHEAYAAERGWILFA